MRSLCLAIAVALALPVFATDPNPSQTQRAQIEKLLALMKLDKTAGASLDAVYGQMQKYFLDEAAAKGNSPEDMAEAKELFEAFRAGTAKIDFAGLLHEEFIRIYAKYFTEQEVTDLVAFYSSPTGGKMIDVMPQLMQDAARAGMEHLTPKIEQVLADVQKEHEKKYPWRRTMSDINKVASALEDYASENDDETYPAGDYASLKAVLVPDYLSELPEKDIWGHPYAYVVSEDRSRFRLASAGADSIFDWDSRRIAPATAEPAAVKYRDRLEDDYIYADGQWLQLPVQAKPKDKQQ